MSRTAPVQKARPIAAAARYGNTGSSRISSAPAISRKRMDAMSGQRAMRPGGNKRKSGPEILQFRDPDVPEHHHGLVVMVLQAEISAKRPDPVVIQDFVAVELDADRWAAGLDADGVPLPGRL